MQIDLKRKTYPLICIAAALILFSCLSPYGKEADAFRQHTPPVITPQPGPPAQIMSLPFLHKWPVQKIISAFKKNGLEVVNIQKGLTMGSGAAGETIIFLIPSSGKDIGGFVSSYISRKALEEDIKYYSGMNKPSAIPAWRIFRRENILVLISGKVPEEKAVLYRTVLESM